MLWGRVTRVCVHAQVGYLILVAVLVAAPLGVGLLASWAKGAVPALGLGASSPTIMLDVRLGLQRALVLTYRDSVYWWEGLLMVQRLVRAHVLRSTLCVCVCVCVGGAFTACRLHVVCCNRSLSNVGTSTAHLFVCCHCCGFRDRNWQSLALVFTFGSSRPQAQSLILTLLCFLFVVAHCTLRPMRTTEEQALQTVLLSALTLVALSCTITSSGSTTSDPESALFAQRMQVVFGVAVPLVAFAWAHMGSRIGRQATTGLWRLGLRSAPTVPRDRDVNTEGV